MSLPTKIPFDRDDSYNFSKDKKTPKKENSNISVDVKGLDHTFVRFKMQRTKALGTLMKLYCQRKNYDLSEIKFLFEGKRVQETSTAESLGINDGDEIDVFKRQDGGSNDRR